MQFEKRNDVLIESWVVLELFDQVEKNVRREGLEFLPHKIDIVVDGEMLGGVTELAERGHDVRLGFPILRLHFLREILIDSGRAGAVEKHEDFEFLFHDFVLECGDMSPLLKRGHVRALQIYLVRLNLPVKR